MQSVHSKISDDSLKYRPSCLSIFVSDLELGHFNVSLKMWISFKIPVKNGLGVLRFTHSFLKFDISHPSFFSRTPLHPPCKHISGFSVLPYQLFHVGILEPELVFSGKIVNGSLPDVSGMIHKFVLHLHFSILQP